MIATAHSEEERAQVTTVGVIEIVDYTRDVAAQVLEAHPDGVDAVVHLAGDPSALLPLVKKGGRFVSTLLSSADQLSADDVTVQNVYSLDEAAIAFADFGKGTLGKLVISIDQR